MFESNPAVADADAPGTDAWTCIGGNVNGGGNGGRNGGLLFLGISITFFSFEKYSINYCMNIVFFLVILVFDGRCELSLNDDDDCE